MAGFVLGKALELRFLFLFFSFREVDIYWRFQIFGSHVETPDKISQGGTASACALYIPRCLEMTLSPTQHRSRRDHSQVPEGKGLSGAFRWNGFDSESTQIQAMNRTTGRFVLRCIFMYLFVLYRCELLNWSKGQSYSYPGVLQGLEIWTVGQKDREEKKDSMRHT